MSIADQIRIVREHLGLSQKDIATVLNVPSTTISKYERGEIKPSADFLNTISSCLNINLNWLVCNTGEMFNQPEQDAEVIPMTNKCNGSICLSEMDKDNQVFIPKYDMLASAGYGAYNSNAQIGTMMLDRRYVEKELNANPRTLTALGVAGDSMEPTLRNGDVVLVDNSQKSGDGIFIIQVDDILYIKRVQTLFNKGIIRLTSDNGFYAPMDIDAKVDNVNILGRVVCSLRKM